MMMMHRPFLGLLLTVPTVIGVLKLPSDLALSLVDNPRPDVVYLFQFARTSNAPSQAALNLKVETWLKWKGVHFHRLNNQFFLGASTTGTAPFAQYNSIFYDSSDQIVETLGSKLGVYKQIPQEKLVRTMIDDILFKILMFDRANSLAWMTRDEGIVQQMGPILGIDEQRTTSLGALGTFSFKLNLALLNALFDAYNHPEKRAQFVRSNLKKVDEDGGSQQQDEQQIEQPEAVFSKFNEWVRVNAVVPGMERVLLRRTLDGKANTSNAQGNSEAKLDQLLAANVLNLDKYKGAFLKEPRIMGQVNGKKYSELTEQQLTELLGQIFDDLIGRLEKHGGTQLFSIDKTPADASLFGILVQYFETPLNYENTIGAVVKQNSKRQHALQKFMEHVKDSLGLGGGRWTELTKYPWTLNYDIKYNPNNEAYLPFKFPPLTTPFTVPTLSGHGTLDLVGGDTELAAKYPQGQLEAIRALVDAVNKLKSRPHSEKVNVAKAFLATMGTYICTISATGEDNNKRDRKGHSDNRAQQQQCTDSHKLEAEAWKNVPAAQLKSLLEELGNVSSPSKAQNPHDMEVDSSRAHSPKGVSPGKATKLLTAVEGAVRARVFTSLVAYSEGLVARNVLLAVRQVNAAIAAAPAQAAALISNVAIGNEL